MVGGAQVTLKVAAWANSTVEDFIFSYSIDGGTSYTDVLIVDDDTTTIEQTVELPVETSDTLYGKMKNAFLVVFLSIWAEPK